MRGARDVAPENNLVQILIRLQQKRSVKASQKLLRKVADERTRRLAAEWVQKANHRR